MKTYDYIILGAGITGVTSGRVLQQKGNENFLILESENEIGGLLRTRISVIKAVRLNPALIIGYIKY